VFLDESGVTTEMTRRYGRAPRGERVAEGTPAGHWRTLSLVGAMTAQGLVATVTVESPTDGDIFLAYVEQVLGPRLRPGQVVVMDNLAAHKVAGVRALDRSGGRRTAVPAALFARLQSHRAGLVQDQAVAPFRQSAQPGSSGNRHCGGGGSDHARQRLRLVRSLRLCYTVKGEML
jgi:DDE superfamily endonuclease